jgi:hypothetical protein
MEEIVKWIRKDRGRSRNHPPLYIREMCVDLEGNKERILDWVLSGNSGVPKYIYKIAEEEWKSR